MICGRWIVVVNARGLADTLLSPLTRGLKTAEIKEQTAILGVAIFDLLRQKTHRHAKTCGVSFSLRSLQAHLE